MGAISPQAPSPCDAAQSRAKPPSEADAAVAKAIPSTLKHYDGQTHLSMFNLCKDIRLGLAKEDRVITEANPVFMY